MQYVDVRIDPEKVMNKLTLEELVNYLLDRFSEEEVLDEIYSDGEPQSNEVKYENPLDHIIDIKQMLRPRGYLLPSEVKKLIDEYIDDNLYRCI